MIPAVKDYLFIFVIGLPLASCSSFVHSVRYRGSNEVWEGDPFQVSCVVALSDWEGWTVNSSITITEDNELHYELSKRKVDDFREELTLEVKSAQIFHEGEYRCNKNSRDFHYVKIIPLLADVNEREFQKEIAPPKATNVYVLKINKTFEFYCSSAKYESTPVSWYKNSRRIVEKSESNVLIGGLSLLIENAQEDDAGEYMCTVDTPFVTGHMDIGRIFHLNSPVKLLDFPKNESIIQGRTLNLHCRAEGFPSPKFTWFIGNLMASELKKSDSRILIYSYDGGITNSYLIMRNMTLSDTGLYTCRAENSIDSGITTSHDEKSVFVHIRAPDLPGTYEIDPAPPFSLPPSLELLCSSLGCAGRDSPTTSFGGFLSDVLRGNFSGGTSSRGPLDVLYFVFILILNSCDIL